MAIVARELGAPLLYVSSSEVFGEPPGAITATTSPAPISGYGRGKLEAEKIVLSGCDGAVVRLFNVYGAGQRLGFFVSTVLHAFRSGNPVPIVGGGRPIRQFTYVGDIARALVDASWAAHPGSVICLAGPDALSLREAVRIAGEVADVVPRLITVTPQALNRLERSEVRTRRLVRPLPAWMAPWRAETTFRTGIRLTLADTLNGVEHA
jgi:nucleoside-diphosphate-sugar epimerase